jgi:hypothetical protein
MAIASATLQGHRVTRARATIPEWGRWFADASIDGDHALSGRVELKIADLTLSGTVLSGGPDKGRSHFRIVAGAGGWGKVIASLGYATDAGVRVSNVVLDAATAAGETVDTTGLSERLSAGFARPKGPAARMLEALAPGGWYVDEAGVTRFGKRPTRTLAGAVTHGPVDLARGTVELAAESIATILPGLVVDGLTAVDVEHTISAEKGLRSRIWGRRLFQGSRFASAIRAVLEQLDPGREWRGLYEYRVVTLEGNRVNLQPIRVSTGMPPLRRVAMRPGLSGSHSMLALGSRVVVAFVDPAGVRLPVILGAEDADGEGFLPTLTTIDAETFVRIGQGALPAARAGDLAGGIWPIAPTQTKVVI